MTIEYPEQESAESKDGLPRGIDVGFGDRVDAALDNDRDPRPKPPPKGDADES